MVQLSLIAPEDAPTLGEFVAALRDESLARDNAPSHVADAGRATAMRFGTWSGRLLSPAERARVRTYFAAVVRRRVLGMHDPVSSRLRRALIVSSIEADLRDAGWDRDRAHEEALRATGEFPNGASAA